MLVQAYHLSISICHSVILLAIVWTISSVHLVAQETKIWEFSPYEVKVWYQFEPTVPLTEPMLSRFENDLSFDLERTFKAAWRTSIETVPQHLSRDVSRSLSSLQVKDLTQNEFTLVVSAGHAETKAVRTFQAAAEAVSSVKVSAATHAALKSSANQADLPSDSPITKLLAKLEVDSSGDEAIISSLKQETIAAAFLPRSKSTAIEKTRTVVTLLPWQTDAVLAEKDKVFLINCSMDGDQYVVSVRELDCPMQHMGPIFSGRTTEISQLTRVTSFVIQQAFAPVARVEAAESTSAELRHKAGGLIMDDNADGYVNPARIRVGDLMQPIIRRDDKNGIPVLLQALNFTYCAVTESDGVKMKANVYSYSGGPGLQGRQNRRTQRVLLRVRPATSTSDVQIVVRGNQKPQSGCFVYSKDFLTNEISFIGRTDWRGRIPIPMPTEPIRVMSDAVRRQRAELLKVAKKEAEAKALAEFEEAAKKAEAAGENPPNPPDLSLIVANEVPIDQDVMLSLNGPLMQLFVKSGDTVLAKLPYIPGLRDVEVAELLDDSLRLRSEAIVRGFQNEILDQIGLRKLLAARVKSLIKDKKLEKAGELVEELRRMKNFNELNDELGKMERSILEQSNDNVPRSAKAQIDRMFKSTRDMLQKYLQEDTAAAAADELRKAQGQGSAPSQDKPAANSDAQPAAGS